MEEDSPETFDFLITSRCEILLAFDLKKKQIKKYCLLVDMSKTDLT